LVTEKKQVHLFNHKSNSNIVKKIDELALDEPVCIFINGEYHVTLIATPEKRKELATGYLLSEGIIDTVQEIESINLRGKDILIVLNKYIDLRKIQVDMMNLIVTACASKPRARNFDNIIPIVMSDLRVQASSIYDMIRELNQRSDVHLRTRGTHAAMICSCNGKVLAFAEDVGRHNAVDKVIGALAYEGKNPSQSILLSTGRQSGEMVQKAARAGFPIVVSITVPLISGVRLAESAGLTLVSFGQGKLKVYTGKERIKN
jgi:FdhD protein